MMRRISCVRPSARPEADSRGLRVGVLAGSMAYSAVSQPAPLPARNGGTFSSMLAAQSTAVSPARMSAEPGANFMQPISTVTRRNSSARRPSLRALEAKRTS